MHNSAARRRMRSFLCWVGIAALVWSLFQLRFAFGGRHAFNFHDSGELLVAALMFGVLTFPTLWQYFFSRTNKWLHAAVGAGFLLLVGTLGTIGGLDSRQAYELLMEHAGILHGRIWLALMIGLGGLSVYELLMFSFSMLGAEHDGAEVGRGASALASVLAFLLAFLLAFVAADTFSYFVVGEPLVSSTWQFHESPEKQ